MIDATNTRVCYGMTEEEERAYWLEVINEPDDAPPPVIQPATGVTMIDPERFERVRRYAKAMWQCEYNISAMPEDRDWSADAEEAQAAEQALQPGDLEPLVAPAEAQGVGDE